MTSASINSPVRPRRSKGRRGRPRDEKLVERRKEEILCQASRVFADLGYQNADVQFIADPLGISKGTVYRYFPTKERLFLAAVKRGVLRLDEHIKAAMARQEDPLAKMAAATSAYLEFFEKYPRLVELFIQERAEFPNRKKAVYFEIGDEQQGHCREMVRGLIESGRLRKIPVDRVMTVFGDLVYGTMFTNYMSGRRRPFQQQAADILDVVFNGILSDTERKV